MYSQYVDNTTAYQVSSIEHREGWFGQLLNTLFPTKLVENALILRNEREKQQLDADANNIDAIKDVVIVVVVIIVVYFLIRKIL